MDNLPEQPKLIVRFLKACLVSAILIPLPGQLLAKSQWECRVSADSSSWDCYKDGNLVMQPMPEVKTAPATPPAEIDKPETSTDSTATQDDVIEPENIVDSQPEQAATQSAKQAESTVSQQQDIEIIDRREPVETAEEIESETQPVEQSPVISEPAASDSSVEANRNFSTPEPSAVETASKVKAIPAKTDNVDAETTQSQANETKPLYCSNQPRQIIREPRPVSGVETYVDADDVVFDENTGIADLQGNVKLISGDQTLDSDKVKYNSQTADIEAQGNLNYVRPDLNLTGDAAQMNLDSETGTVENAIYILPGSNARGSSGQAELKGQGISVYRDASYTTCEVGNNDWVFNAEEVELDENTGVGTAKHMKLYFMDMPIAYVPWATFPIDDRRKSGFLTPSIGSSDKTGFDLSTPYYFNLAPNYDATFYPRIMSDRGIQLGGEFRYLDQKNTSWLRGEIIPDDNEYSDSDPRGSAQIKHTTRFNSNLRGYLDLAYASDEEYLEDFGSSLEQTSTNYLQRDARLYYSHPWFSLSGRVLDYQTLSGSDRYALLPQVRLNSSRYFGETDFSGDLVADYSFFDHDSLVKGGRFDLAPSVTYDWNRSWGFVKPKATLRYTTYDLDNTAVNQSSSIDRTVPTFSLDSGLFFDRDTSWFGQQTTQTLEPRLFYVYTPEENQDDIPRFDSDLYTFGPNSLFRENRFTGSDRIGDANQLTAAVTTRFLSNQTGQQYLEMTLGQIFYFEDREVGLSSTSPIETENTSPYIFTLSSKPAPFWYLDGGLQWDDSDIEKSYLRTRYEDDQQRLFSARYQFDDAANQEFTKFSAYWPVGYNTRLVGHSYYSWSEERAIESLAGIEHGSSCCWRFRFLVRDYQTDASQDNNLGFYMQLELRGFANIGDDIDSVLEDSIEGFNRRNYQ